MGDFSRIILIITLTCLLFYHGVDPINADTHNTDVIMTIESEGDLVGIVSMGSGIRDDPYIIEGLRGNYQLIINSFSKHLIVRNNTFSVVDEEVSSYGLSIQSSSQVIIHQNLFSNLENSLSISSSSDIEVSQNIFYSTNIGIKIQNSNNVHISSNLIENPTPDPADEAVSVALEADMSAVMINNNGIKKFVTGIELSNSTAMVTNNEFSKIGEVSLTLDTSASDNRVFWNNYLDNPRIKASDNGVNNTFQGNYWSGWTSPDEDNDGTVDLPFSISGLTQNMDNSPKVQVNEVFLDIPQYFIRDQEGNNLPQITSVTSIILLLLVLIFLFLRNLIMNSRLRKLGENSLFSLLGVVPPAVVSIINSDIPEDENELNLYIPQELMEFKKLLDPVRLSIFTILYDEKKIVSSDLRKHLKVSWGTYSHGLKILVDEGYIEEENEFINETFLKVLLITHSGEAVYRELKGAISRLFGI